MSGDLTDKNSSSNQSTNELPHLGQLFFQSQLITGEQLAEVCDAAQNPLPRLGQKLVLRGFISHSELHDGLHVQCLLRENAISTKDAISALRLVREQSISAEEAVAKLQVGAEASKPSSRFGDLLVDARILTQDELNDALSRAESTNLPLGQILTMSGLLSDELLLLVTDMQNAIREQAVDREQAIIALSAMAEKPSSVETSPIGVQPAVVAADPTPPVAALSQAAAQVPSAAGTAEQSQPPSSRPAPTREIVFADFMVLCGILQRDELERARKMCDGTNFGIETVVKKIHGQKNWMVELAGYCFKQMASQEINLDQGIFAFDFCKREIETSNCSIAEAANRLSSWSDIKLPTG